MTGWICESIKTGLVVGLFDKDQCPQCQCGILRHNVKAAWIHDGNINVGRILFRINKEQKCVRLWLLEFWEDKAMQQRSITAEKTGFNRVGEDMRCYQVIPLEEVLPFVEALGQDAEPFIAHLRKKPGKV